MKLVAKVLAVLLVLSCPSFGVWLDASDAEFYTPGNEDRCEHIIYDGGDPLGAEGGTRRDVVVLYNLDGDSWDCFMSWEVAYPEGRWTSNTYHATLFWEGNDDSVTSCAASCISGGMCAVTVTDDLPPDEYCSASSEYSIDASSTTWAGKCDLDHSACTQNSDCTGASNLCWTNTFTTASATAASIYIGDTSFGVGQAGDDNPCTGTTCHTELVKFILRINASSSVAVQNMRLRGVWIREG